MGMAFTLVVNPGSSSKKFALYQDTALLLEAYIERSSNGFLMCSNLGGVQQKCDTLGAGAYKDSLGNFITACVESGQITEAGSIDTVAMRVVAPGTYFQKHQEITKEFEAKLAAAEVRAPLHIPHIQQEIEAAQHFLPKARLVGISDSAFHSTLSKSARNYSLPTADVEELDLYRFGYHGISVASVTRRFNKVLGSVPERAVVCHIGSGVSITALKNGKSVDTTMGYAPGSGLIMGTRAGDVDTGALLFLMQQKNYKPNDAQVYLQSAGGLKALGGESDLRILLERRARGEEIATETLAAFIYQLQKTIGGYAAILGGLDAIVLTATASERSPAMRDMLLRSLQFLGFGFDTYENAACINRDGIISTKESAVTVAVIKTNEAEEMAHLSLTI